MRIVKQLISSVIIMVVVLGVIALIGNFVEWICKDTLRFWTCVIIGTINVFIFIGKEFDD